MFTMLTQRAATPTTFEPIPAACPKCGTKVTHAAEQAHRRIQDLEDQVKVLNSKATAAVDRIADYEDEVRALKAQCARLQAQQQSSIPPRQTTPVSSTPELTESPSQIQSSPPRTASRLASLSSFFISRTREVTPTTSTPTSTHPPPSAISNPAFAQSTPNLAPPPNVQNFPSPPATAPSIGSDLSLRTLQSNLENERTRRLKAESSLNQTQTELEELTAQLFGQANEMVAAERKARYKLEERVKILENRDGEKRRRLERLEKALQRIERVRGLVERRNTVDVVDASVVPVSESEDDNQVPDPPVITDPKHRERPRPPDMLGREKTKDRDRERPRTERKGTV